MNRTQLNINIDPSLLEELKKSSIRSGKTLSNFLTEIISKFLSEDNANYSNKKINEFEKKIGVLERQISVLLLDHQKITPFTEKESRYYSEFIREVFNIKFKKGKKISRKKAFINLIDHIQCFYQWNEVYTLRLKEILFVDDYDPFSAKELNNLSIGKECPCPIRTGLINWISGNQIGECSCSNLSFPSQQEICDKGLELAKEVVLEN